MTDEVTPISNSVWNDTTTDNTDNIDNTEQATADGNSTNLKPEEKRRYKLIIDGNEEDVDEDEVIKRAQKATAADKKFSESAQLRKQAEQLLVMLKKNPIGVLTQLGINPTEMAKEHLTRELQNMRMTPEERELAELRAEREERQRAEQEERERLASEQEEKVRSEMAGKMEKEIISALESVKLPRDEASVEAMAKIMMYSIQGGVDITWEEAAMIVKDNHKKNFVQLFSQLGEDELADFLGDANVKKLVKRSTKNIYKQEPPREQPKRVSSNRRNSVWDD